MHCILISAVFRAHTRNVWTDFSALDRYHRDRARILIENFVILACASHADIIQVLNDRVLT